MRTYNPNPKHEGPGARGRKGTRLDLSPTEATQLLNDPIHCLEVPDKRQLVGVSAPPMAILAYIPFFTVPLTVAATIGVARQLRLSQFATLLAVLCLAFLPLTQSLYGIGIVDHHYIEHLLTIAALWAGLKWINHPDSRPAAAVASGMGGRGSGRKLMAHLLT